MFPSRFRETESRSFVLCDFSHKAQASNFQQRPWSPLCSKSAGYECSRKFCKFGMVYHHSLLRKERPWEPTRDETRWPLAQNNNTPDEVLHFKRESDEKSVHLQVLQVLHILCFTDVNSETKTHFFLRKFLKSTSEYMNQKRQVFQFLIQGALRELISHDSLSNLLQSQGK